MSSNQAAQQIAGLLTQAGVPAGHSLDIAQRLLSMSQAGPAASRGDRLYTAQTANNSDFQNKYKTDEANALDGADGRAGKDGLSGYGGTGVSGSDGMPGIPGNPGEVNWDNIKAMIAAMIREALANFVKDLLEKTLTCQWFRKKFEDCITLYPGGDSGCSPKCCVDEGPMSGRSICDILRKHAITLGQHERRIVAIEKDLKNTTDCEA